MPKYVCKNIDCDKYDKISTESCVVKVIDGQLIDSSIKCKSCGSDRHVIEGEGMTTMMHGGPNVCKK